MRELNALSGMDKLQQIDVSSCSQLEDISGWLRNKNRIFNDSLKFYNLPQLRNLGDLKHILKASGVGAVLETQQVASTLACTSISQNQFQIDVDHQLALTFSGGDDYELVFTAPADRRTEVQALGDALSLRVSRIGAIEAEPGLRLWRGELDAWPDDAPRQAVANRWTSFDHFKVSA